MAKFKPCNEDQLIMLPISLQDQLVPGTLEHTLSQLVDKHIDLSVFDERYNNDETGATAIHPKILLKVILLAYSRGMISSRQIERACQENIIFIALSYGYAPDHSTIAQFISSMHTEVQTLFSNILLVCEELGLLNGTHFSLDGVKLSAKVSKEWSGTFEELKHKRDKLHEKLQQVMAEHAQADQQPEVVLERQKKRERRFQLQVERLNQFLQEQEPKRGSDGKEIQSNVMDNESVKMPTAHGVVQGYNAQALVDSKHQVILAAEAFASQDHENLAPMLEARKRIFNRSAKMKPIFRGSNSPPIAIIIPSTACLCAGMKRSTHTSPTSNSENAIRALRINNASRRASIPGSDQPPSPGPSLRQTSLSTQPNRFITARKAKN